MEKQKTNKTKTKQGKLNYERKCGILMPIFSLPSKYGIGDFGKTAYNFIDFLKKSKVKVWQILPLVQTGYGNSPYSSISQHSISPYYISIEMLKEEGLLSNEDLTFSLNNSKYVDYGFLYNVRYPMLKKAFNKFDKKSADFIEYSHKKEVLDYALFMAIKEASGGCDFNEFSEKLRCRDKSELNKFKKQFKNEILFWEFIQYKAEKQWFKLKEYANKKGIEIFGDMPLYVALDSVDVWVNPHLFKLNDNYLPVKKAGVPPDYFCADGQLWGNPVFNYEEMKKDNYSWWVNRLKKTLSKFDLVRIDHFRGLDRYYEIEGNAVTAKVGEWTKVPSKELFTAIHKKVDKNKIIAEDLGIIDDGVRELLKTVGYPGMKILSFAFNGESGNPYLPETLEENSVCYTGTHDNDTLKGLISSFSEWDYNNFVNGIEKSSSKMGLEMCDKNIDSLVYRTIELGMKSKSKLFIMPLSDILFFGSEYRINVPGQVKEQNWAVRYTEEVFTEELKDKIKNLIKKYNR